MRRSEYVANFLVSPLGLGIMAVAAVAAAGAAFRFSVLAGAATGIGSFLVLATAATISGLGPKAASAERERKAWSKAQSFLTAAKASRDRLASLRVPDPAVKALLELAAMRGSSYLSACEATRSRDPRAEEALSDCVSIADLYLKELDGASTERRYKLEDTDPFADARERTLAALRDRAAILEHAALSLSGGLSSADRMEIKESL
jgi:hypothetical protein